MKSICRIIRELFYGPDEVTPKPLTPESPPVETFCRSNRYTQWLDGMVADIKATKATLIEIKCFDDDARYRAVYTRAGFDENVAGHARFYNTLTLEQVSVAEIFRKGVEHGTYLSADAVEVDDRADFERSGKRPDDPREHDCIARFANKVVYRPRSKSYNLSHMYHYARGHHPDGGYSDLGVRWATRWELAKEWNEGKLVYLGMRDDKYLCIDTKSIDRLFWEKETSEAYITFFLVSPSTGVKESEFTVPVFAAKPFLLKVKALEFFCPGKLEIGLLFDPVRVRKLGPDEEHGQEAYVALKPGSNKDTYTRVRYRVEIDSELLLGNTICKLTTLYKAVDARLRLEGAHDNGKLYVDNFHYMRLDGTEHTADPSGFASIGAEPYYDRRERVYRNRDIVLHYTGPFIITNQDFPIEPIY